MASVALVTGAAGGIGGATADALEAAGHDVVCTDLPLDVSRRGRRSPSSWPGRRPIAARSTSS